MPLLWLERYGPVPVCRHVSRRLSSHVLDSNENEFSFKLAQLHCAAISIWCAILDTMAFASTPPHASTRRSSPVGSQSGALSSTSGTRCILPKRNSGRGFYSLSSIFWIVHPLFRTSHLKTQFSLSSSCQDEERKNKRCVADDRRCSPKINRKTGDVPFTPSPSRAWPNHVALGYSKTFKDIHCEETAYDGKYNRLLVFTGEYSWFFFQQDWRYQCDKYHIVEFMLLYVNPPIFVFSPSKNFSRVSSLKSPLVRTGLVWG